MDADASGLMRVSKALVQDKGSSTNKQDVVASEGQSVFKKRSLPWSRSPLCWLLKTSVREIGLLCPMKEVATTGTNKGH